MLRVLHVSADVEPTDDLLDPARIARARGDLAYDLAHDAWICHRPISPGIREGFADEAIDPPTDDELAVALQILSLRYPAR